MKIPWLTDKLEQRASNYTDFVVEAALRAVSATGGQVTAIAALESCAGHWARGMAAAKVKPASDLTAPLTSAFFAMLGRGLLRRGQVLWEIQVVNGRLQLLPITAWDVVGGPDPASWIYNVEATGPNRREIRTLPASAVVHARIGADPASPWIGRPPMATASDTASLVANLELRLGQEAGGPVGSLAYMPTGNHSELAADLKSAKGSLTLATLPRDWTSAPSGNPRFGANPPPGLVQLRSDVQASVYAACGVPGPLLEPTADGTSQREAWRRMAHGTLAPVLDEVGVELADKLGTPGITFDISSLYASDLVGRAQVFSRLVQAEVPTAKALAVAFDGLQGME